LCLESITLCPKHTQEIATLRALGFGGAVVAFSVISEVLAGALIGIGIAWVLFHGQRYAFASTLF
jgi:hypothetical protein